MKRTILLLCIVFALAGFPACTPRETAPPPPTDQEITAAYQTARQAYEWFDMTTMPLAEGEMVEQDGHYYLPVRHGDIQTAEDLREYLLDLFHPEIVDSLLAEPGRYTDIDGVLHAIPADRGSDIFMGEETHSILRESDTRIVYRVEVELLDDDLEGVIGTETHEFPYELLGETWVFTEFALVR